MHTAVELQLPFPISVNRIWTVSRGRLHRSADYVTWLTDAGWAAKIQKPGKVLGPYKLTIQAKRPDKRKRDLDNILKATSDLLVSLGIVEDDEHCEMLTARWVTQGEGINVRIERAGIEV